MTDTTRNPEIAAIAAALANPFEPKEVKFKPQMVKNNRALAMGYIDARLVCDRLDEVLGVENWQDRYEFLPDGSVVCTLRLCFAGRCISKTDVGSPSEQPDSGDRVKAAVSDALKRAAVKFGIGRYLYRLPAVWCDYDPVKKQLVQLPQLPTFALPKPQGQGQKPPPAQQPPKQAAASPPAKPAEQPKQPAQSPKLGDPVHDMNAFLALLESKNKSYASAISWLGTQTNRSYPAARDSWPGDVPEADRKLLVDAVRKMPDVRPQQQKAG